MDYIQVTVLEKGVKRKINIPENDAFKNRFNTHSAKQLDSKEGIVLSFKDQTQVSVDEFESKYGIKLERKLVIGYYIFKNMSEYSDIQIDPMLKGIEAPEFLQAVTLLHTHELRKADIAAGKTGKQVKPVSAKRGDILQLPLEAWQKWADEIN